MPKHYTGHYLEGAYQVTVTNTNRAPGDKIAHPLDPRTDLRNHSPTGFAWGYAGSGPSQLALALCADLVGPERAERVYQEVKIRLVSRWPQDLDWALTAGDLLKIIREAEAYLETSGAPF